MKKARRCFEMTPEERQNICDNIFNYISKELYGWMDNQIFVIETMEDLGQLYYNHVLDEVENADTELLNAVIRTIKPRNVACEVQKDYYNALCKILYLKKLPSEVWNDVQKEYDEIFVQKYNVVIQKYQTAINEIDTELSQTKTAVDLIKNSTPSYSFMRDISTDEQKLYELCLKCKSLRTRKEMLVYVLEYVNSKLSDFCDMQDAQSVEYAKLEKARGYKEVFLALVDDNNSVHAATLILEKKLNGKYKYGYIPNGYLINFFNYSLLEIFTNELKQYLKKANYIFLRLTPLINYQIYNSDFILKENNSSIISAFKKLNYNYLPNNSRYKMVLVTNNINKTFQNFKRSLRRNIDDCLKKGIEVHQGTSEDLDTFLKLIDNKDYYKKMSECFTNPNNKFEFYLAKINPETYIIIDICLKKNN